MSSKLYRISAQLGVSMEQAQQIIDETNHFLPQRVPNIAIEEAIRVLPIPFRQPLFIAAQLVKKYNIIPNKLLQSFDTILGLMIQAPIVDHYEVRVVGVAYEGRQSVVKNLQPNDAVVLKREPYNPYDCNAIKVIDQEDKQIGYIDRNLAAILAHQLDRLKDDIRGSVVNSNPNSYPIGTLGVIIQFDVPTSE